MKRNLEFYRETSFSTSSLSFKEGGHTVSLHNEPGHLSAENREKTDNSKQSKNSENFFSSFCNLFRYANNLDKWLMVAGSIAAIVNGFSMPFVAIILGQITDLFYNVTNQGFQDERTKYTVESNETLHYIGYDKEEFFDIMMETAVAYGAGSIVTLVSVYLQVYCWEMGAERQVFRLRKAFFSQVLRQDNTWFDLNTDGDISHKLSDDMERIREGIGAKISFLLTYCSTFIVGLVVGFLVQQKLTLLMLISAPIIIAIQACTAKTFFTSAAREQLRYGVAGGVANEVLNSFKLVASFSAESRELKRYKEALEEGSKLALKKYYTASLIYSLNMVFSFLIFAVAFRFSAYLVQTGEATPGQIFAVFLSVMSGAFSVGNALPYMNMVFTALGSSSNIYSIIDRVPRIDPYSSSGTCIENLTGEIEFHEVDFSYPSRPQVQVLRGLNLKIEEGKTVAVVGPSGSGKSTLINLILRFYEPASGKVSLDGIDLSDLNLPWLRGRIGLVSQEPVLFSASISENIRYGCDHVTIDEIKKAAVLANADSFIQSLPEGYDTEVGSRGTMLSGGQKQRIAIARALIRNPKILLLDEATSALDSESEAQVQEALERAMKGRTTVIVAHRLSTIKRADLILTMKDGSVYESGTHEELMALGGLYYTLVTSQLTLTDKEPHQFEEDEEQDQPIPQPHRHQNRRKSVVDILKRTFTLRSRKSSVASEVASVKNDKKKQQSLADNVAFTKILGMASGRLWYLAVGVIASVIMGVVLPLNASFYGDIFKTFMLTGDEFDAAVTYWTYVFLFTTAIVGITGYMLTISFSILTEKIIMKMRESAFKSLLSQECGWYDQDDHSPSKLINSLSRDPPLIKTAAGFRAGQVLVATSVLVTSLLIAFFSLWKLAVVLCLIVPLIILANLKEIQLIKKHQERDAILMNTAGQVSSEAIHSVKTVQALTKEKHFIERYNSSLEIPHKENKRQSIWYSLAYALSHSLLYIMYGSGFVSGAYFMIQDDSIEPSQIFKAFFALNFCATSLGQAASYLQEFYKAKISIAFVYQLIEEYRQDGAFSDNGLTLNKVDGEIQFVGVEFKYPSRKEIKILRGINLKIPQGCTVALVGRSGCGKSTIMALLQRFYNPSKGQILLDGVNITDMNIKWLRQHFGVVTQEPQLLNTSIKENIAYGAVDPDAVTMNQIIEASRTANIHQFIATLPKGYETQVGEMGGQLSGGQKQRIAIARAIIRNPNILLLDEATSALDTESEKVVQEALEKAKEGRTCIIIAHRLSTIRNADLIAVVQHGRVIELGTHNQLIQSSGYYSHLVQQSLH